MKKETLTELIRKNIEELSIHYSNSWYSYRVDKVVNTGKTIRLDLINKSFEANGKIERATIHINTRDTDSKNKEVDNNG